MQVTRTRGIPYVWRVDGENKAWGEGQDEGEGEREGGPLDEDEDEREGDPPGARTRASEREERAGNDSSKFRVTGPLMIMLSNFSFFRLSVFSCSGGPCFRYHRYLGFLSAF